MAHQTEAAATQYLVVNGTGGRTSSSYVWRFWQSTHSFYALARHPALGSVKVSMHGPHDQYPGSQVKVERGHQDAVDRASRAGGVVFGSTVPGVVAGRVVAPGVRHVATLRWTAGLFRHGLPDGLGETKDPAGDAARVRIDPPTAGELLDVRLYISDGYRPAIPVEPGWWPLYESSLSNTVGQHLSIAYARTRVGDAVPTPGSRYPPPRSATDRVRALRTAPAGDVVWVVEELTSRTTLQEWQEDFGGPPAVHMRA